MYNATNAATWLRSPPRIALRCNSTQRFVCYNASPRGSAFHSAPRLPAAHRASIQLNDLFVTFRASTRSDLARRVAAPRIAPQRNDLFVTSRLHATSLNPTPRGAFQLNDLFVNLSSQRDVLHCFATLRAASQRAFPQRNDLFVIFASSRSASQRDLSRRGATHLSATQRFVYYNASPCIAPQHITLLRADQQRNELKLN